MREDVTIIKGEAYLSKIYGQRTVIFGKKGNNPYAHDGGYNFEIILDGDYGLEDEIVEIVIRRTGEKHSI